MADFFSFEYFDELPDSDNAIIDDAHINRKNQSLSASAADVLREAMVRLVPSNYVYGHSSIGERAYELFGVCISRNFAPNRSSNLVACSCVMHASYEKRSDLVILPSDVEAKYADKNIRVMRASQIRKFYESMCEFIGVKTLDVVMERLLGRIFRDGCRIRDEATVAKLVETGLRFEKELRNVTDADAMKDGRKRTVRQKYKAETLAAVCAVLASRFCNLPNVTQKRIAYEVNLSVSCLYHLLNRYKKIFPQPSEPPPAKFMPKGTKANRLIPLAIGDMVVPSGLSISRRDDGDSKDGQEEVIAVLEDPDRLIFFQDPTDPLALIFNDALAAPLPPIPADDDPKPQLNDLVADYADLF